MSTMYQCPACDTEMPSRGWSGHTRSKKHARSLLDMGLLEIDPVNLTNPDPGDTSDLLAEYEAQIASLQVQLDEARPEKLVPVLDAKNVENVLGRKHLEDVAERQLVSENRSRRREDRRPLWENQSEFEDLLAEKVEELKVELVARQTKFATNEGNGTRVMKMIRPDGNMVQLPVEDQINNGAAAPGSGVNIHPFRDNKGFKIVEPYRCELMDCWAPAKFPQGNEKFCTPEHAALIPKALEAGRRAEVVREFAAR